MDWLLNLLKPAHDWFQTCSPQLQASLVGVVGTFVAASAALIGVILTLRFNRWKHRQDRELTIRKDLILAFLDSVEAYRRPWGDFTGKPEPHDSGIAATCTKLRLVSQPKTIEMIEAFCILLSSSGNTIRATKQPIARLEKRISDARERSPDLVLAIENEKRSVQTSALETVNEIISGYAIELNLMLAQFRKELGLPKASRFHKVSKNPDHNFDSEAAKFKGSLTPSASSETPHRRGRA